MLDLFPTCILTHILSPITSPKDMLHLCLTCRHVKTYIENECTDVIIKVYHNPSLGFYRHLKAVRSVFVYRKYDTFLDFTPLIGHPSLKTLFVNNIDNTFNIPSEVNLSVGTDNLVLCDPLTSMSDNDTDNIDHVSFACEEIMDAKDFFTLKYKFKKYSKIKYKDRSFHLKTRHLCGSL